jgi:hypothetical protein
LFAGAGLSAQAEDETGAHPPLWGELLETMVGWCVDNRVELRAERSAFLEIIHKKRFLVAAQELQERLGGNLGACLRELLHVGRIRPSEAHLLIPQTDWVAVLTSNYDAILEGAFAVHSGGIVPPVYTRRSTGQALESLRRGEFFLFKVHGDVNEPETIILGDRDYSRILYMDPGYRSFLEMIFATYTVLFVGFGAEDPDLNAVIERLSAVYERSVGRHFLLVPDVAFSPMERRRLLEDKRLDCITYVADDSHSQLREFLKALAVRAAEGPSVTPPFDTADFRPRIFISGSYRQLNLLRRIADLTQAAGFAPWFAERELHPGDSIVESIAQAIGDCDCMLVVISQESVRSPWVEQEAERAFGSDKLILPVRIGDAPVPEFLQSRLYLQLQTDDLTSDDEAHLSKALAGVRSRLLEQNRRRLGGRTSKAGRSVATAGDAHRS